MKQTSRWDALLIVLLHILAGPPVGGLAALALVLPFDMGNEAAPQLFSLLPVILIGSYIVGTVPAALTGVWAAVRLLLGRCYGLVQAGCIACMIGSTFFLLLPWIFGRLGRSSAEPVLLALAIFAAIVAALACRWLMRVTGFFDREA